MTALRPLRRWTVAGAMLAVLVGQLAAPGAGAATPPPFVREMSRALAAVHSYQIDSRSTSSGPAQLGGGATSTLSGVVVRQGKVTRLHVVTVTRSGRHVSFQEIVDTGTHLCLRQSKRGAWNCNTPGANMMQQIVNMSPDQMAKAFGLLTTYKPAGRQTKQGQPCMGYGFSTTASGIQSRGTLWVSTATHLPVEQDAVTSISIGSGSQPLVTRSTQVWNHWNDPGLTIPHVPAA